MKIGFALITENPFLEHIVKTENELSLKHHFLSDLGIEHNLPHTTLFQENFRDDLLYEDALFWIARECKKLGIADLEFADVRYIPDGWYFWCCNKTDKLQILHDFVLSVISDYIILDPDRMEKCAKGLTEKQMHGLSKYGYIYSREAFFPHITLARTSEHKEDKQIIADFNDNLLSVGKTAKIQKLTVYKMGDNGVHEDTLAEVRL